MNTRIVIPLAVAFLLAGCASTGEEQCAPLIQDEKRNQKDLDAFCYTEATQDTLKCEKAKDERDYLRERRHEINNRETVQFIPFLGPVRDKWVTCPTQ